MPKIISCSENSSFKITLFPFQQFRLTSSHTNSSIPSLQTYLSSLLPKQFIRFGLQIID